MPRKLTALFQKFKEQLAPEVPAEVAACEFDCDRLDCSDQEWKTCANRLQKENAIKQNSQAGSHQHNS
ncbi:hypothetical protein C7271_11575 [filamentous cyanobacterium CCP5]|nr:hypothetical protein C7271_11575 [filamentous cyanobacterium CCP5]